MIKIETRVSTDSVGPKNNWLDSMGLEYGKDYKWTYTTDEPGERYIHELNHIHTFADEFEYIAILFALRWS